jgi:hypothetical protein
MADNTFHADEPRASKLPPHMQAALDEARDKSEKNQAMLEMMADLTYPESKDGSTLDISFFQAIIAWHLVRCGYRKDPARQMIKPRRLIAQGLPPDAVEWVPVDAPDQLDYSSMTLAQINQLDPRNRAIALRQVGGPETPSLPDNPGWHVQTSIDIQDAPDPDDDGYAWTGRKYRK